VGWGFFFKPVSSDGGFVFYLEAKPPPEAELFTIGKRHIYILYIVKNLKKTDFVIGYRKIVDFPVLAKND